MRQAVTWADVKANIVVKQGGVASRMWPMGNARTVALAGGGDSGAQRSFFRTFDSDSLARCSSAHP